MVTYGAGVSIDTLTFILGLVSAAVRSLTAVQGTGVVIAADGNVVVLYEHRFVSFTVAIVILPVASFDGGEDSVAVTKSILSADTLAGATT